MKKKQVLEENESGGGHTKLLSKRKFNLKKRKSNL